MIGLPGKAGTPKTSGKSSRRRPSPDIAHSFSLGSFIGAALVIIVIVTSLWQSHQDTWERAQQSAANLRQSIIGYIDQHIQLYTLSLNIAVDVISSAERHNISSQTAHAMLDDVASSIAYVGSIVELDAHGNTVFITNNSQPGLNFADRDYFVAQRDNTNMGVYISKPFLSRLHPGVPSIALSRRLSNPDGSFAGIVAIAIRLSYIEDFLASINIGQHGALLLISTDGRVLIRQPSRGVRGATFTDLSQTSVFKYMKTVGAGTFVAKAAADGVERYFAFAQVPGQPLIVNVAFATQDIFRKWWYRSIGIGTIAALACGLIVAMAVLLRRELRRRMLVEADLARLSMTDGLTGLANRRRYDEVIQREWRRASRVGAPLALLFLDVDGFKQLNDQYGHAIGDEILKALAKVIGACIRRPGDQAARYGGEEFAVVLSDTTHEGAMQIAENIRAACESMDSGLPRITVSIGVKAIYPSSHLSVERFQEDADKALYEAKAAGRNRVVLCPLA